MDKKIMEIKVTYKNIGQSTFISVYEDNILKQILEATKNDLGISNAESSRVYYINKRTNGTPNFSGDTTVKEMDLQDGDELEIYVNDGYEATMHIFLDTVYKTQQRMGCRLDEELRNYVYVGSPENREYYRKYYLSESTINDLVMPITVNCITHTSMLVNDRSVKMIVNENSGEVLYKRDFNTKIRDFVKKSALPTKLYIIFDDVEIQRGPRMA